MIGDLIGVEISRFLFILGVKSNFSCEGFALEVFNIRLLSEDGRDFISISIDSQNSFIFRISSRSSSSESKGLRTLSMFSGKGDLYIVSLLMFPVESGKSWLNSSRNLDFFNFSNILVVLSVESPGFLLEIT